MSDSFRSTPEKQWSGSNGYKGANAENSSVSYENTENGANTEVGKTLLVGVLGGILSAAGYLVYQRLPDEQKERLHGQVKGVLQQRINELRQNFNI
ncbi:MAG TPA: hypothetical protein VIG32_05940 [Candidatus Baltobacteraceae bacterium]|jgi:hypothetical protein